MQIYTLGQFKILQDGNPAALVRSHKAAALLLYLASTKRSHSREALADIFWEATSTRQALSNLRTLLARLQKQAPGILDITQRTVAIATDVDYLWVDALALETQLEQISQAPLLNATTAAQMHETLQLYRGAFLEGFHIPATIRFDEWILIRREQLFQMVITAFQRLSAFYEHQAEWARGIEVARRWIELDPLDEAAHRQLMRFLAVNEQRTAALAHYETCCQILDRELGVSPDTATSLLYEQIRTGEFKLAVGRPSLTEATTPDHNLPAQVSPFVGRQNSLQKLDALLAAPDVRLVSILAPGGMGKTRLGLAAAQEQLARQEADGAYRFSEGIYWVDLAEIRLVNRAFEVLAAALKISLKATPSPREQVSRYLASKKVMLVFDNAEHLLPELANQIVEFLQMTPQVKLLVTSRLPLKIPGENRYPLRGLPYPKDEHASLEEVLSSPAGELFWQRARATRADFDLNPEDATALARICQLVGGMPLALELAAAWVDTLSVSEISVEVARGLDLLFAQDEGLFPARQKSVQRTFDYTYERLSPAEQDGFSQLSIFRGGFIREAAQEIAGLDIVALSALVKKALLSYDKKRQRYEIHPLLCQYAKEKLMTAHAPARYLEASHSQYYLEWLGRQPGRMSGLQQARAFGDIEADFDNIQAAWEYAARHQKVRWLEQAVEGLYQFIQWQTYYRLGIEMSQETENFLRPLRSDEAVFLRAQLIIWQSVLNVTLGNTELATKKREEAGRLLASLPENRGLDVRALYLRELGKNLRFSTPDEACRLLEESVILYQQIGKTWDVTISQSWLAYILWQNKKLAAASKVLEDCLALQQDLQDQRGISASSITLAQIQAEQGKLAEAEILVRQGVRIRRGLEDLGALAVGLWHLGKVLLDAGKLEEAEAAYRESLQLARVHDNQRTLAYASLGLGRVYLAQEQWEMAAEHLEESASRFRGLKNLRSLADALGYLSMSYFRLGRESDAKQSLTACLNTCQELGLSELREGWYQRISAKEA